MEKNRHMSEKLDIIGLYLSNYNASFTGREIARQLQWNHQTTSKIISSLVKEKILHIKIQGKNHLYTLTLDSSITIQYIALAEQYKSIQRLENFEIKKIIETLSPYSETIILFGSFAKYKEKADSDVDLIVINPTTSTKIEELKKLFSREINLEYSTWKKFESAMNKKVPLSLEISKNHLLYGNILPFIKIVKQRN